MEVVEQISRVLGNGIGLAMLALAIGAHAVWTAKWAGRMEEALQIIRDELPKLRDARHDHANLLAVHQASLDMGQRRFQSHSQSLAALRTEVNHLARFDERLTAMDARLRRMEDMLTRYEARS